MKIKVFIDAHVFDGEFQGTRTYIKEIYSIVSKNNPDVFFYFAAHNLNTIKSIFGNAPNVHYIKYKSKNSLLRLGLEIPFLLVKHKITYAHFQYITPFIKVCKYITTIHDVLFYDFKKEFSFFYIKNKSFFYKFSAGLSDYVTTVSEYSKGRLEFHYPFLKNKLLITPNAVNDSIFKLCSKEESRKYILSKYGIEKYILYVSRIEPRKNHHFLLKAFLNLDLVQQGYSLVFIGKKTLSNKILDDMLGSQSNLDYFYHFESIEDADLKEFYNGAQLFVYPSMAEGFGIPPLEAGIMKTPVLCSNKTAMQDFSFFNDGLFDPGNELEFQTKLDNLLKNGISQQKIDDIYKAIFDKYRWDRSAEIITKIFKPI